VLGRAVGASLTQTTLLVSEAQTCAQLEHPSIVPVYDFGPNADQQAQYTMRLVRGRTLRKLLQDRTQSLAQCLGVLRQVCLAVAYAHTRGVVHRDLKPENVICGEFGEVYVLDWGISFRAAAADLIVFSCAVMSANVCGSIGGGIGWRTWFSRAKPPLMICIPKADAPHPVNGAPRVGHRPCGVAATHDAWFPMVTA
jgi:hypothetical protein